MLEINAIIGDEQRSRPDHPVRAERAERRGFRVGDCLVTVSPGLVLASRRWGIPPEKIPMALRRHVADQLLNRFQVLIDGRRSES
jgi:hypothetical protein